MTTRLRGKVKDDYLELILKCPLVALRHQQDFEQAEEFMQSLLRQGKLTKGQELYLDALSDLVASYEDEHYPIAPSTDAELLSFFMEDRGVTQAELSRGAKIHKSTISQILSGDRPFSKGVINKLSDYLGVDKSVFTSNL